MNSDDQQEKLFTRQGVITDALLSNHVVIDQRLCGIFKCIIIIFFFYHGLIRATVNASLISRYSAELFSHLENSLFVTPTSGELLQLQLNASISPNRSAA